MFAFCFGLVWFCFVYFFCKIWKTLSIKLGWMVGTRRATWEQDPWNRNNSYASPPHLQPEIPHDWRGLCISQIAFLRFFLYLFILYLFCICISQISIQWNESPSLTIRAIGHKGHIHMPFHAGNTNDHLIQKFCVTRVSNNFQTTIETPKIQYFWMNEPRSFIIRVIFSCMQSCNTNPFYSEYNLHPSLWKCVSCHSPWWWRHNLSWMRETTNRKLIAFWGKIVVFGQRRRDWQVQTKAQEKPISFSRTREPCMFPGLWC